MTTNDLADKLGFSKRSAKSMLSGRYNFNLEEIAFLDLLFNGHYDLYEKKLLIEKMPKKEDSSL